MPFYPVLSCKSCSHSIWLPFPSPDETPQRQIPWPPDGMPRNFGCSLCKRVYEYSPEDVRWRHVGSPDQLLPSKPLALYRSMHRMLTSPIYGGAYTYGKTEHVVRYDGGKPAPSLSPQAPGAVVGSHPGCPRRLCKLGRVRTHRRYDSGEHTGSRRSQERTSLVNRTLAMLALRT